MPSDPTSKPIDSNEVSVLIDRKEYRFWSELELHLSLDNHASVSFEVPFEPQYKSFRDTFTPFSFKPLEVHLGGNLVFTGNLIDVIPQAAPGERKAEITAYSKPGVLAKSDLPASAMPSEMRGLKLHQIAEQVCKPLGIDVIAQDYQGAVFKKVKCGHSTKVQAFLVDLAQQRGQVISSTNEGKLRLWRSVEPGHPIANLEEGQPGITNVQPTLSPLEYYSEITGFASAKRGRRGSFYTHRNTRFAGGIVMACTFSLDDTEKADAQGAVDAKMGRMFANCVSYVVDIPSWNDPSGRRWQPNTTLNMLFPSAMIYNRTELLVRDVFLRANKDARTASLGLVLPGSFSGKIPDRLPWEE
jgi:prophage tail gpP-like protein